MKRISIFQKIARKKRGSVQRKQIEHKTLNGRLPSEDGSVRPQTLGNPFSDDSRQLILRHQNQKNSNKVQQKFSSDKIFGTFQDFRHFCPGFCRLLYYVPGQNFRRTKVVIGQNFRYFVKFLALLSAEVLSDNTL